MTWSEEALKKKLAANPYMGIEDLDEEGKTEARRQWEKARREKLHREFETVWRQLGGPELETEYQFHPDRKWRFDYCRLVGMVAIELQGGIWQRGRHTRGVGYVNDCEKLNAAQMRGWRVMWLATGMITPKHIEPIIKYIKEV